MDDIRKMFSGGSGEGEQKTTLYDMEKLVAASDTMDSDESIRKLVSNTVKYVKMYYDAALEAGLPEKVAGQMTLMVFGLTIEGE
jgi:hypothetical protein